MNAVIAIYPQLAVAFLVAVFGIVLKRLVDRQRPSLEDASDVAWILLSIGIMIVFSRSWPTSKIMGTIAWDVLFASILLINRRRKLQLRARLVADGIPIAPVCIGDAVGEVMMGLLAIVMTAR